MDAITFHSNELERLLEKFDDLTKRAQDPNLVEGDRESVQAKQMALVMTDIPRARARLRLEMEKAGKIRKAPAIVPQLEVKGSDESGWTCSFQTYMVEDDVFWNGAPTVQGKGASPKDARSDFWIAWKSLCKRRHGRNLELREIGRPQYQQRMKAAQEKDK